LAIRALSSAKVVSSSAYFGMPQFEINRP
jgi:hypothetical protein